MSPISWYQPANKITPSHRPQPQSEQLKQVFLVSPTDWTVGRTNRTYFRDRCPLGRRNVNHFHSSTFSQPTDECMNCRWPGRKTSRFPFWTLESQISLFGAGDCRRNGWKQAGYSEWKAACKVSAELLVPPRLLGLVQVEVSPPGSWIMDPGLSECSGSASDCQGPPTGQLLARGRPFWSHKRRHL